MVLSLNISVARSCFVRCRGCYNHFGQSSDLLSSELLLAFLRKARGIGIRRVTLCGGDPLARPDIMSLLAAIKALGFSISLDTVGTPLLGPARTTFYGKQDVAAVDAERLTALVDIVGIPVDGPSDQSIATFRTGRAGFFDEQLAILDILQAHAATVCVNTVVHRQNADVVPDLVHLLESLDCVAKWQLFQFMPIGPLAHRHRHEYEIDMATFTDVCARTAARASPRLRRCIEPKANGERKGRYLLVDSEGYVWMSRYSYGDTWNQETDSTAERVVFGNLADPADHAKVLEIALAPHENLPALLGFHDSEPTVAK